MVVGRWRQCVRCCHVLAGDTGVCSKLRPRPVSQSRGKSARIAADDLVLQHVRPVACRCARNCSGGLPSRGKLPTASFLSPLEWEIGSRTIVSVAWTWVPAGGKPPPGYPNSSAYFQITTAWELQAVPRHRVPGDYRTLGAGELARTPVRYCHGRRALAFLHPARSRPRTARATSRRSVDARRDRAARRRDVEDLGPL